MSAGEFRQPRGLVVVEGTVVPASSLEVENNTFYEADTFRASLPFKTLPPGYGPDWWAAQASATVEVFAGNPEDVTSVSASDLDSLIYGKVDDVDIDWEARVVSINGRDLTAAMIDTKTNEKYRNLTASQIVAKIAAAHGLTPVVTETKTKVGLYYQIDHVQLQDEKSEWDLLTFLARHEDFALYVAGKELHFEPKATPGSDDFQLVYVPPDDPNGPPSGNATRIRTSRSLTLAKDIKVTVRSWNQKSKKGFTVTAKRASKSGGKKPSDPQEFSYTLPNLGKDQAQQWANNKLAELSAHELKLSFDGPARPGLKIAGVIALKGTGTDFDQSYFPDSIRRTLSATEGYAWAVQAKNHSGESEPNL